MNERRTPSISTHVLDTERGLPAAGVPVTIARWEGDRLVLLREAITDADGRIADLLGARLTYGGYRLTFDIGVYFRELDGDMPFFTTVTLDIEITDDERHYHIPLLASRFACTSYRGS